MGHTEQSIQHVCGFAELKKLRDRGKGPVEFKPYNETLLSENLDTAVNGRLEKPMQKYKYLSKSTESHMASYSTLAALSQGTSLVGGFKVKQDERTVHEDSGAHRVTTSNLGRSTCNKVVSLLA